MIKLVLIAISLYVAYYTFAYMIFVIKKERNIFAGIFLGIIAAAIIVLPFMIKIK